MTEKRIISFRLFIHLFTPLLCLFYLQSSASKTMVETIYVLGSDGGNGIILNLV
jgi:hypothetical protein